MGSLIVTPQKEEEEEKEEDMLSVLSNISYAI
jgi:hypothetical protein